MEKTKRYPIENFYIGELYLHTNFCNFTKTNIVGEGKEEINNILLSGAIPYQKETIEQYIDFETGREYQGFLTIFYQEQEEYICLHNGISYRLDSIDFIENLVPLISLIPKIDNKNISKINISQALDLFKVLFTHQEDITQLYNPIGRNITDFYVGEIEMLSRYHQEDNLDSRYKYIDLPHHIMLNKDGKLIDIREESGYTYTTYKCLMIKIEQSLYNINNSKFYNFHDDIIQSLMDMETYMAQFGLQLPKETMTIPKALKLFKKTI